MLAHPATAEQRQFRFSVFHFDALGGELRKQGQKLKVEGQPLRILAILLERPGEVITREDLKQRLWPADTFVDFEHSINTAVKRLRQALDDSAETPRFIETLPRRGYRFIYPLASEPAPGERAVAEQGGARRIAIAIAGAGILLAMAIALAFGIGRSRDAVAPNPSPSPEAYQLYLKGRYLAGLRTRDGLLQSVQYFERAIAIDPGNALAYAGLSDAWGILGNNNLLPSREAYPKARAAALKALELNDKLAEAHLALALVKFSDDWDWPGAEREYRRALELNPAFSDAHQYFGRFLSTMGRHDEAIAETREALRLDPLSFRAQENLALAYFFARRYDAAIDALQRALELDPNRARGVYDRLGWVYTQKGMYPEAIASATKAVETSAQEPLTLGSLAHTYGLAGRRADALHLLRQLEQLARHTHVSPVWIAYGYIGLHDYNVALDWLEQAYNEHDSRVWWIKADPHFDPLRAEPRFQQLLRRLKLD